MTIRRIFLAAVLAVAAVAPAVAQRVMTPPHVMIVPDLIFCKNHGYIQQFDNMGTTETVPDYEKALTEDPTLHSVLMQMAQLITDRNSDIVIVDLLEAINNAKADAVMAANNGGDDSESVDEAIIRNSGADILVKVQYDMLKTGPQYQVNYTIAGTDAYTNQMFAPVDGMGRGSTSVNPVLLLRESVANNINPFLDKMLAYYGSMAGMNGRPGKGRMVAFEFKTTSTSPYNMNSKVGEYTLREQIEDFLYDNSVEGNGLERVKGGSTFLQYQGVYIPLVSTIRGRQRKQGAKDVAQKLSNYLQTLGVDSEYKIRGLGKVNFYIK